MATTSPIVTLNGLNTVYKDIRSRLSKISNIYHVQGTITWPELISLIIGVSTSSMSRPEKGFVYNISLYGALYETNEDGSPKLDENGDPILMKGDPKLDDEGNPKKDSDGNIIYKPVYGYHNPGYFPTDPLTSPSPSIINGSNVLCISDDYDALLALPESERFDYICEHWEDYLEVLDGFLEEATFDTPGVIKLGSNDSANAWEKDSDNNPNEVIHTSNAVVSAGQGYVLRGLSLKDYSDESYHPQGHKAGVTIPIATPDTYGLISTAGQKLAGPKEFENNVTVDGKLSVSNNNVSFINKLSAAEIQIGDVTITATDGVLTFS